MHYRQLGKTGISVSEIGLGTEHLAGQPAAVYDEVFGYAVDKGVNYVDILMPYPDYRDNIGRSIRGIREKLVIAGHIGVALEQGQYLKTRDVKACRAMFEDLLTRLGTDGVDVVMLQWVDGAAELDEALAPGGTLELAARLKREGKARAVGLSTHEPATAVAAVESVHLAGRLCQPPGESLGLHGVRGLQRSLPLRSGRSRENGPRRPGF